jgi:Pentapeptide repeats (8 copies)
MSGPGDVGGEVSGEEAAWRQLVAQYDLTVGQDLDNPPWPERESLPAPRQRPARRPIAPGGAGQEGARDGPEPDSTAQGSTAQGSTAQGSTAQGSTARDGPGPDSTAQGSTAQGSTAQDNTTLDGTTLDGTTLDGTTLDGTTLDGTTLDGTTLDGTIQDNAPATHADGHFADRTRIIRHASDPRSYSPPDEPEDGRYVPAPLPPVRLDPVAKGAWVGLVGGPAYLLIGVLLGWTISGIAAFAAIAAFVVGFVILVLRLGDGSKRDDDDDGAVV